MISFFINTYVECFSTLIGAMAIFYPSLFSLPLGISTQILFIGLPLWLNNSQQQRLQVYEVVVKIMTFMISLVLCYKIYFVWSKQSSDQSYGVYFLGDSVDYYQTFMYESVTLLSYLAIWGITYQIKSEVDTAIQLKIVPNTFLGNRSFCQNLIFLKSVIVALTLLEALILPDLLALPVLFAILSLIVLMISKLTNTSSLDSNSNDQFKKMTFSGSAIIDWAMTKEKLFTLTMLYQKVVMMIQLTEYIATHIHAVRMHINLEQNGLEFQSESISTILYILRSLGHTEYQSIQESQWLIWQQMGLTIVIIFLAQVCTKAIDQYYNYVVQDELNGEQNSSSIISKLQSDRTIINAQKVIDATLKMYQILTFDRRNQSLSDFRKSFYGFMPVLLTWIVRITVSIFAYVYNSYVGFIHLFWILSSFIIPQRLFYSISVIVFFPIVCFEFSLIYLANVGTYRDLQLLDFSPVNKFTFTPEHPFLELSLIYVIVIFVGLMIPARNKFIQYDDTHNGSDMTKDMLVKNIKDANSSVFWKIIFIMAVRLHTPMLFLMLFIGNQNFSLFQLGFMFFFVAYGASHSLYVRTSIMLPLFICFFILSQYWWSLEYANFEKYNQNRDFFYLVDGWVPPQDTTNFYWFRPPNKTLWGLLMIMHLLHTVCAQFPDSEQNNKYVQQCDKHISERIPFIAKWVKLTWHAIFMILLVTVMSLVAKDLIEQKSNFINLIYYMLFVITFGKMFSTSLDGSSHIICIKYAKLIKGFSGSVLFVLVFYHMMRFELFELDAWFQEMKEQAASFPLFLTLFGFSEDESGTKYSVQRYTAYLIVGQILEYNFDEGRMVHESRDLYDWNTAFKSFKGVKTAHQYFQFDIAYTVYRWFSFWKWMDFVCTYFHLITNGFIIYFGLHVSVSLFFAIHISIIVFFYCYNSYVMHKLTKESGRHIYDVQQATDVCRRYKKFSSGIFLRSRQSLWMTQYVITLFFMFMGYLGPIIDEIHEYSETMQQKFEFFQFYMYWTGCYFPATNNYKLNLWGLKPVHYVFLIIIAEKQAQNWLFSRWGLNQSMISKYCMLEFFLDLDKKGSQWLPKEGEGVVQHSQDIIAPGSIDIQSDDRPSEVMMMEEFNNALVGTWRRVKLTSNIKRAIAVGIRNTFSKSKPIKFTFDEHVDTMSQLELGMLEKELLLTFNQQFEIQKFFFKYKTKIEGRDCVLYTKVKDVILEKLYKLKLINQVDAPFISYSLVRTLRQDIHQKLYFTFLDAALEHSAKHNIDIQDKVEHEKSNTRLFQLRGDLMKIVNRRYSYEMWGGIRMLFEQASLFLLMLNVVIKCNIASLVHLTLVTNYLWRESKQTAMRNMVYILGPLFFAQYWMYLLNLTSESSPTPFPTMPYPDKEEPYGKHLIPIMYKFEFGRHMQNAYWYSFGVEMYTVHTLWIDFITLALVALYLYYYRNPVLSQSCQEFKWFFKENEQQLQNSQVDLAMSDRINQNRQLINFQDNLKEYHSLMIQKYPTEINQLSGKKRLRQLKDNCFYYVLVRNGRVLIYTTMHIFTMIVILLMALCRTSMISLIYILVLLPYLATSSTVLNQHENYNKCKQEIEEKRQNPEFIKLTTSQQNKILRLVKRKYEWSFIKLICIYLSIYTYLDFVSQVAYQIPYIPDMPIMEHFGLRKIFKSGSRSFDYDSFISGNYEPPTLNYGNLLMQIWSCIIVMSVSTQSELFKSKGYISFLKIENQGLDLLMKLAQLKKLAISYSLNNQKMIKILQLQKTEQQIFGCVERMKLNMDLFRKSQQRIMLEEYCRTYGGMYIPPDPQPKAIEAQVDKTEQEEQQIEEELHPMQRLKLEIAKEKHRRDVLVTTQTLFVTKYLLPPRASFYLFLMKFSSSYIFIHRERDMVRIVSDMEQGSQDSSIDLNSIIRADLFAYLKRWEKDNNQLLTEWPTMTLQELRQTFLFCQYSNVVSRQGAAICRALISNTSYLAYACMMVSMYINAGVVVIVYPFAVFGFALLEESRPGKRFWRFMLSYSLFILILKFTVNLNIVNESIETTTLPFIDDFVKFGLRHLEQTDALVWHMLPEMLIVMVILCHEIVEQFTGLYDQSEHQIETVPQAIDRIFKKYRSRSEILNPSINKSMSPVKSDRQTSQPDKDLKSNSSQDSEDNRQTKLMENINNISLAKSDKSNEQKDDEDGVNKYLQQKLIEIKKEEAMEFDAGQQQRITLPQFTNDNDDNFVRDKSQGEKSPVSSNKSDKSRSSTTSGKESKSIQQMIWSSAYFNRIFPRVQQQKPGTDLYGYLTFVQCVLCYYLLTRFNQFSATGPYQEQTIFQTEMVVVLFYQIFMIIMERYIARTENREQIERQKRVSDAVQPTIQTEQLFLPATNNDLTVKLVIQQLKFQFLWEKSHVRSLQKLREEQDVDIQLTESFVTPQQKCKFILHWFNLMLVHFYIFWYLPIHANTILYGHPHCSVDQIYGCKDFDKNEELRTFYLLYLVYFFLSARQISQGLPSFRRGSSTMLLEGRDTFEEEEDIGNAMHQCFINMPLAAEIRCLLDFTFTRTSLDLFQTCQLFQYNSDFYIAKTLHRQYNRKPLGEEPTPFNKGFFGYFCATVMLSFILVPFIIFSSAGGTTIHNPVLQNDLQFWVQVNLTTTRTEIIGNEVVVASDEQILPFKLYDNESPSIYTFDQNLFNNRHFNEWPETKFFDVEQLQLIVASYYSDTTWIASDSTRASLQKYACIAVIQRQNDAHVPPGCQIHEHITNIHNVSIGFQLRTEYNRDGPAGFKLASGIQQRNLDPESPTDEALLSQFSTIMTEDCSSDQPVAHKLNITDFFGSKILLGETTNVEPIYFSTRETQEQARQNILLTYKCKDQWAISTGQEDNERSLEFIIFSQRIQLGFLQGYDILTFYTGIVLLIGMYMRPIFIWTTNRAFIYECNYPDPMLRLCESIYLCRARGDLKMEDENFRFLQDILRSPELLHALTGSNMKGQIAPTDEENYSHLVPKAFY